MVDIKDLEEQIIEDLTLHPLDRNPAILAKALERIRDLDKKLDQAIDLLDSQQRAFLLNEWMQKV